MRILFDNVNFESSSGPNSFGLKLSRALKELDHNEIIVDPNTAYDVQLSFISVKNRPQKRLVLRLDGIYFNSAQDFQLMNEPIKDAYFRADAVVVQSQFDKKLIETFFGEHKSMSVIGNGTDLNAIHEIKPCRYFEKYDHVWCCASSWRPHKRLNDNVRYFKHCAPKNSCFVIMGDNVVQNFDQSLYDERILFTDHLSWEGMISVFKNAEKFVHLAYLDHCPNVVVDARASGCEIVCASSGGTAEIAGLYAEVIEENEEFNFSPIKLYEPPRLNLARARKNVYSSCVDICETAREYNAVLQIGGTI